MRARTTLLQLNFTYTTLQKNKHHELKRICIKADLRCKGVPRGEAGAKRLKGNANTLV